MTAEGTKKRREQWKYRQKCRGKREEKRYSCFFLATYNRELSGIIHADNSRMTEMLKNRSEENGEAGRQLR
jgi:hypothetical protein